jgi:hypothetical protein
MSPESRSGKRSTPFLRTSNVLWGRLDLSSLDHMDFTEEQLKKLSLKKGDLLICEGDDVGRTAMWREEIPICSYQNHIQDNTSDHVKIINLSKSIKRTVVEQVENEPYLITIGERANTILDYYDDRQINTREALTELEKLLREYNDANKERREKGFDTNTFSIYWVLKKEAIPKAETIAPKINSIIERRKNYRDNVNEMRNLKTEIYKALMEEGIRDLKIAKKLTNSITDLRCT